MSIGQTGGVGTLLAHKITRHRGTRLETLMPDSNLPNYNELSRLGRGEFASSILMTQHARQEFLLAVQRETPEVLARLRRDVYSVLDDTRAFEGPLQEWLGLNQFVDQSTGSAYAWVEDCAIYTLEAWAVAEGRVYPKRVEGVPIYPADKNDWASANGRPAFDTRIEESGIEAVLAGTNRPPDKDWDFIFLLPDGNLAALGSRFFPIEAPLLRSACQVALDEMAFTYNPEQQERAKVRDAAIEHFTTMLDTALNEVEMLFRHWKEFGDSEPSGRGTSIKASLRFALLALSLQPDLVSVRAKARFKKSSAGLTNMNTAQLLGKLYGLEESRVREIIQESRRLVGMARPRSGRPRGSKTRHRLHV